MDLCDLFNVKVKGIIVKDRDSQLDELYDKFDTLFYEGRFETADALIYEIIPDQVSTDYLLGVLTVTLPAKSKLLSRHAFFDVVEHTIKGRGEWEEGLLDGLE